MPAFKIALGAMLIGVMLLGGSIAFRSANVATPSASPAPCEPSPMTPSTATGQGSPAPSPTDTSTWVRFTSSRYGYSMCVPPDWAVTPGVVPWAPITSDPDANAAEDRFVAPFGDTSALIVTSTLLPPDMTEDQWFASYVADLPAGWPKECWPDRAGWGTVTVDGHPAAMHGGMPQCNFTEVITFVDGRIYVIAATPNPNAIVDRVFDWGRLYAFIDTVKLDPAAADDSPAASPAASPG
jgi:hypothetical protein